jgi:hypothetical protein
MEMTNLFHTPRLSVFFTATIGIELLNDSGFHYEVNKFDFSRIIFSFLCNLLELFVGEISILLLLLLFLASSLVNVDL